MFKKKISLIGAFIMTVTGIAVSYIVSSFIHKPEVVQPVIETSTSACKSNSTRLGGYEFISPLLFGEQICESQNLMPIKNELENIIREYKNSGKIKSASVYLRKLKQSDWISIDNDEKFNPGSLLKVPELITFMKMKEKIPGLLDKKITYSTPLNLAKQAYYVSKSIEVGKTYTIRELMFYMIAYSDNYATMLLNQQMDLGIFQKVFTDLGIDKPDVTSNDIPITAKEYSYFMRVLYNASYLDKQDSEFCTELLSHSVFAEGMMSGLPKNIKVIHKFGEAGDSENAHFNESGIVYINNSPYLLTIMTKGNNKAELPPLVSIISKKVFEMINAG